MDFGNFNWIDGISVAILLFAIIEGWRLGFIHLVSSFLAYSIALYLSIRFHHAIGVLISKPFGIPIIWIDIIGYVFIIVFSLLVFTKLFIVITEQCIKRVVFSLVDRVFGVIISICNACIFLLFLFVAVTAVPDLVTLKQGVEGSIIARKLLQTIEKFGGNGIVELEKTIAQNARFMAIDPNSNETIKLPNTFQRWNSLDDKEAAKFLFKSINTERVKNKLQQVMFDESLTTVALAHSKDMFERQYFSHISPDGKTMKDRLDAQKILYTSAAENLAYAPDENTAHKGLMNSVEHRQAILDPLFNRIGIGVVDSGGSGIMVTELFVR